MLHAAVAVSHEVFSVTGLQERVSCRRAEAKKTLLGASGIREQRDEKLFAWVLLCPASSIHAVLLAMQAEPLYIRAYEGQKALLLRCTSTSTYNLSPALQSSLGPKNPTVLQTAVNLAGLKQVLTCSV